MSRAPRLTLETVLCDRRFFGLETATPVQRACCRVIDGLPLGELADDANVIALVGGAPALASLPVGQPPHRVDIIGSIRSAKSMTAAAAAFAASQTVDVSGLKPGEVPRIPIVAPRMDLGRVEFGMLCAQAAEKPAIAARLIGQPTSDTIVFRHPSGMPIEVMITAASSGGTSLVSRWVARAIFTEAPRTASETEGAAVNLESMLAAVDGRLLRGGSIITNGSPTTPTGEIFNAYEKRFGKPTPHHVVLHGTGPMFNPGYFTPEKCAQLQESNRRSYVTDVLVRFDATELGAFDPEMVAAAQARTRQGQASQPVVVMDASGGGGDAFCFALAFWIFPSPPPDAYLREDVYDVREAGPAREIVREIVGRHVVVDGFGTPMLDPKAAPTWRPALVIANMHAFTGKWRGQISTDEIVLSIARLARAAGARTVVGDQFSGAFIESALRRHGLKFEQCNYTASSKPLMVSHMNRMLRDGSLVLPNDPSLTRELMGFREIPTQSGTYRYEGKQDDRVAVCLTAMGADMAGLIRGSMSRRGAGRNDRGAEARQ